MAVKIKHKMLLIIILIISGFMGPKAMAMKLTLSNEGLMLLDEYSTYQPDLKATILDKRYIEGAGVEFEIYFPGNKSPNNAIYYIFSEQKLKELFEGVDVSSYDAFELKFTLVSVDGDDSPENGGVLIVGALINGAYRPEGISLSENQPRSDISTTRMDTNRVSKLGFTAHMLSPEGWDPNGAIVTVLIEPVAGAEPVPQAKEEVETETEKIIYVDSIASGSETGTSWTDAFRYLQDGLADAVEGDQIWVASGIYRPDEGMDIKKGDKTISFVLKKGVVVYGGFPNGGGGLEDISPQVNVTILSGDLEGNDAIDIEQVNLPKDSTRSDNSYRVVSASGTDFNTILDGFIITGGNAKGASKSSYNKGGGLYCKSGSPILLNCVFNANSGMAGGAMYNLRGDPLLINCIFLLNYASDSGGGMYSSRGSPILYNCVFGSNTSKEKGGGVYNEYNSPITINCTFSENEAYAGGGIYCDKSKPIVTNCILWGNSSRYGKLEPSQIYALEADISYSCIQGLREGMTAKGNISLDPNFLNAAENDFNLRAGSPCIDAGVNDSLPSEIKTDVDGGSRWKDGDGDGRGNIDIGAQEF